MVALPTLEHPRAVYCIDVVDLLRSLPSASVDVVFTDPDYGVPIPDGEGGQTRAPDWVADSTDSAVFLEWFDSWAAEVPRVLRPGGTLICWTNSEMTALPAMKRYLRWRRALYWVKSNAYPNTAPVYSAVEIAVVLSKRAAKGTGFRYNKEAQRGPNWFQMGTTPVNQRHGHPTSKRVEVMEWVLSKYSYPGDLIVDPFCGSGSIGAAAIQLGRRYLGGDSDSHWTQVTRDRLRAIPLSAFDVTSASASIH